MKQILFRLIVMIGLNGCKEQVVKDRFIRKDIAGTWYHYNKDYTGTVNISTKGIAYSDYGISYDCKKIILNEKDYAVMDCEYVEKDGYLEPKGYREEVFIMLKYYKDKKLLRRISFDKCNNSFCSNMPKCFEYNEHDNNFCNNWSGKYLYTRRSQ